MKYLLVIAAMTMATVSSALAGGQTIDEAVQGVVSPDAVVVQQSIGTLRQAGPAGLDRLLNMYAIAGRRLPDAPMRDVINAVAGQRDAVWSRLYWYTDLAEAEAAAKKENKPILYLRLLGKLTDEYSCANSRFFRTVLYANQDVSKLLREQFILVWVSEREVPVISIDYGDGRVLKRTITGNSIHYILDSRGRVIDALPGLYGPEVFARILGEAAVFARGPRSASARMWAQHIEVTEDQLRNAWAADAARVNPQLVAAAEEIQTRDAAAAQKTGAAVAAPLAMGKMMVEAPMLRRIDPQFAAALDESIAAADLPTWQKIAALHADDAKLDASSIALIQSQNPQAYGDPKALERTVTEFERLIALDTVRNNYSFRRQILTWLGEAYGPVGLESLNRRVYSELFLTPRTDPWLGLAPERAYTALINDGCFTTPAGR